MTKKQFIAYAYSRGWLVSYSGWRRKFFARRYRADAQSLERRVTQTFPQEVVRVADAVR